MEFEAEVAKQASQCLDKVHAAYVDKISQADLGFTQPDVDLLVDLDVLEHPYNPWDVLANSVVALRPSWHVVVSTLNVQNLSVILNLTAGRWDYEVEGLLDTTHLRFFALRMFLSSSAERT